MWGVPNSFEEVLKRGYTFGVLLTTREAADRLGVSISRIHQLIQEKRLKAREFGPVYIINSSDLDAVKINKTGRPRLPDSRLKRPRTDPTSRPRKLATKKRVK